MEYFPSIEDFNLDTCAGKSQYLAHLDLEPIRGLIEQTNISISVAKEAYGKTAIKYDEKGEHYLASKYFDMISIFSARIVPLSYQSILLILFSLFEEALKTWCRGINIDDSSIPRFEDFVLGKKSGELERAIKYIEKFSKITNIEKDPLWDKVRSIRTARKAIVHNGGRVEEKYRKYLEEFNIGMREENFSVYIDYETMTDMYNTIMEFLDRIFSHGVSLESGVN